MVTNTSSLLVSELGRRVRTLSAEAWGTRGVVHLIGGSPGLLAAQQKLERFARVDRPVLITGESGVGKELFAKSLYLLSPRYGKPFVSVNCAQYQHDELLVSELFGHRKGSFTGATADRRGLFEAADGGVVFLDEVGELSLRAQAMLLRVLSEGEVKPLGETRSRHVDVRVVAATNRPLKQMVAEKSFREDLYYRLRYLHIHIPPLRERGDDWRALSNFFLAAMARRYGDRKQFSESAVLALRDHHWPGNVRELKSVVDISFCMADGASIEPEHFAEYIDRAESTERVGPTSPRVVTQYYQLMAQDGQSFWSVVRDPFLDRELNREQVRAIVARGLGDAAGSYKKLLNIFHVQQDDYLKFMDFLRHHRLKPHRRSRSS